MTSHFYTYGTMGYEQATTITPGKGYWVKVTQPGSLVLSSIPPPMAKIRIVPTGEMPPAPPGEVSAESNVEKPREFTLGQNFPNPFNPSATIRYSLPHNSFVTLTVYNTLGQQVAQLVNEQQQAGYHDVVFRGDGLASGVYFYRLDAGSFTSVMKLLLLK